MFASLKKRFGCIGLLAVTIGMVLSGCGHSPLTSDTPEPELSVQAAPQSQEVSYFAFSPLAPFRAAKYSDGADLYVDNVFGPAGDIMGTDDMGDEGTQDDLIVTFEVMPNALPADTLITMTVTKGTLSHIVAAFAPCGLNFATDSQLKIVVGNELVDFDLSTLIVYHIHGDGTVEHAGVSYSVDGDYTTIYIDVPGFSRYGLGDSDTAP